MKRATLLLEDEFYKQAKVRAKSLGITLKEAVNDFIREGLHSFQQKSSKPSKLTLPIRKGLNSKPGLDLSDRSMLYDLMDNIK